MNEWMLRLEYLISFWEHLEVIYYMENNKTVIFKYDMEFREASHLIAERHLRGHII